MPQLVDNQEAHSRRLASIYADIEDPKNRKWLEQQLGTWSNERRLARRLRDLLELAETNGYSMPAQERKAFIREAKTNRDILSHGGLTGRARCSSEELFRLETGLRLMLHACFASELGLSNEQTRRVVAKAR